MRPTQSSDEIMTMETWYEIGPGFNHFGHTNVYLLTGLTPWLVSIKEFQILRPGNTKLIYSTKTESVNAYRSAFRNYLMTIYFKD